MIAELFQALWMAGIPVGIASWLLMWWALREGHVEGGESVKDLEGEIKRLSEDKTNRSGSDWQGVFTDGSVRKARPLNFAHNKWLAFGGGFYGVVALLTYAVVEVGEIGDFISSFTSFNQIFSSFGVQLLIKLFIESLLNFITAITWPVYWLSEIDSRYYWTWFVGAYAGYHVGARLAMNGAQKETL